MLKFRGNLPQFRTVQKGPFFKSKMEIKGCVYVQDIIAAFLQNST